MFLVCTEIKETLTIIKSQIKLSSQVLDLILNVVKFMRPRPWVCKCPHSFNSLGQNNLFRLESSLHINSYFKATYHLSFDQGVGGGVLCKSRALTMNFTTMRIKLRTWFIETLARIGPKIRLSSRYSFCSRRTAKLFFCRESILVKYSRWFWSKIPSLRLLSIIFCQWFPQR